MLVACERQREWPAKLVAGVEAGLEFAAADSQGAIELMTGGGAGDKGFDRTVVCLCAMLTTVAPAELHLPVATHEALVGGVLTIVAGHLRRDRHDRLLAAAPDLVLLLLLPYLGFDEARRWAATAAVGGG